MNESTTTQEAAVMGFLEEYIFQKPLDPSRVGGSSLRFLPCGCLVLIDDGYVAQYILVTYEGRRCEDFDIHEIIAQYEFLRGRNTDVKGMRDALEQWAEDLGTEKAQEMLAAFDAAVYARTPKAGEK